MTDTRGTVIRATRMNGAATTNRRHRTATPRRPAEPKIPIGHRELTIAAGGYSNLIWPRVSIVRWPRPGLAAQAERAWSWVLLRRQDWAPVLMTWPRKVSRSTIAAASLGSVKVWPIRRGGTLIGLVHVSKLQAPEPENFYLQGEWNRTPRDVTLTTDLRLRERPEFSPR